MDPHAKNKTENTAIGFKIGFVYLFFYFFVGLTTCFHSDPANSLPTSMSFPPTSSYSWLQIITPAHPNFPSINPFSLILSFSYFFR